jgi:hypothetical protein
VDLKGIMCPHTTFEGLLVSIASNKLGLASLIPIWDLSLNLQATAAKEHALTTGPT